METKKEIRTYIKNEKKKLSQEEILYKSSIIAKRLIELPEYINSKCIFIYVNFNEEVITRDIISHAIEHGKRVAVPVIKNQNMDFYYINGLEDLSPGYFGILEPRELFKTKEENPCIIMPGLAFNMKGHRIGYGKGFYDEYLKNRLEYKRIALAYKFQVLDKIPYGESDIPVDKIVTEGEVITVNPANS